MITITKSSAVSGSHPSNNWSFLPTAFSAAMGVAIGIAIALYLGWI